ncbi:MAG: hypothetical protein RR238_10715 [Lachnospiraceae bacterium]
MKKINVVILGCTYILLGISLVGCHEKKDVFETSVSMIDTSDSPPTEASTGWTTIDIYELASPAPEAAILMCMLDDSLVINSSFRIEAISENNGMIQLEDMEEQLRLYRIYLNEKTIGYITEGTASAEYYVNVCTVDDADSLPQVLYQAFSSTKGWYIEQKAFPLKLQQED